MLDHIATFTDVDLRQKRVVIREDLNVPMQAGKISDDERIKRALPTLQAALAAKAAITIISHLGRPPAGQVDEAFSLAPVAERLSTLLQHPVTLHRGGYEAMPQPQAGEIVLLENIRFAVGETENDSALAQRLTQHCDIFVMDAFASAHRAHASTVGMIRCAPKAVAGPLLVAELKALSQSLDHPKHPLVAVVGGSKVSTKIKLLTALVRKVDTLIVGGGIANTFLKAQGFNIGKSLYEADWVQAAGELLAQAQEIGVNLPLPEDVVVAPSIDQAEAALTKRVNVVEDNEAIFDVGPATASHYDELFQEAATIVWNGPVGVFEIPAFSQGTVAMARAISASHAFSLAGGGDTLAALAQCHLNDKISYLSTGGGAFLEYIEGGTLPAIAALQQRTQARVLTS